MYEDELEAVVLKPNSKTQPKNEAKAAKEKINSAEKIKTENSAK